MEKRFSWRRNENSFKTHLGGWLLFSLLLSPIAGLSSCSDDKDEPSNGIVGEWISDNGHIYYKFNSNGTGRYICLADEPGYNPDKPDAVIAHPVDPEDFTYTIDGDIITMTSHWTNWEGETETDIEEYTYNISDGILSLKEERYFSNGEWNQSSYSSWTYYNRWK